MKKSGIILLILIFVFQSTVSFAWKPKKIERTFKYFKKELLLKCPEFIKNKNTKIVEELLVKLRNTMIDKKIDVNELNDFSWDYAVVLDKLKTCNKKTINKSLKGIFYAAEVDSNNIDNFFEKTEENLKLIKKRRDDIKTAAGILTKYGLGKEIKKNEGLLKRNRSTGFASKAKSGEINEMVEKYTKEEKKVEKNNIRTSFDD